MALAIRGKSKIRLFAVSLAVPLFFGLTGVLWLAQQVQAASQTYIVTTTADGGVGSLRQAILDSNANISTPASPNKITFNIPNADPASPAVQTISLQSELPQITQPVQIDGTTQAGASCGTLVPTDANGVISPNNTPHKLMVEVTTVNIPSSQDNTVFNLYSSAANSSLKGLDINGAQTGHMVFTDAPSTSLTCNYMGTNVSGDSIIPADGIRVAVFASSVATAADIKNNLISSAAGGVRLDGEGSTTSNNLIGYDKAGMTVIVQNFFGESRGVTPNAPNQTISHNVISGYDNAINGNGANALKVQGNFLGVKIDGITGSAGSLQRWAIRGLTNSDSVTIGGPNDADRNIMTGQADSMRLEGLQTNTQIINNYFGLGKDGTTALPASAGAIDFIGVNNSLLKGNTIVNARSAALYREGSCDNLVIDGNYIGVTKNGDVMPNGGGIYLGCNNEMIINNVISGNVVDGIYIKSPNAPATIKGNIIGLKPDGVTPAPNGARGIYTDQPGSLTIGGPNASDRNIIAANGRDQILIENDDNSNLRKIQGNYICLNKNGDQVLGGASGLNFNRAANIMVGGGANGEGNVIGCQSMNILQDVNSYNPIYYYGNIIGLKPDGETVASTSLDGRGQFAILLRNDYGTNTYFGGGQIGQGNILAGMPQSWGMSLIGWGNGDRDLHIKGNKYGVTKSGKIVGNYGPIQVAHIGSITKGLVIGGDTVNEGNEIAGTIDSGVTYDSGGSSYGEGVVIGATDGAIVKNNHIHDNARNGITVYGDSGGNNIIERNTINNNGGIGVGVSRGYDEGPGILRQIDNTIRFNSIYSNTGLGVDLGPDNGGSASGNFDASTPNDPKDPDTGPNNLQNYPVIEYQVTSCDGTTKTAPGGFNSTPNTTFTIDYYSNPSWNTGDPLQGETWISSETVTTDANGDATFHLPTGLTNPTMTATDPQGNTSEFGGISTMGLSNCQDMNQRTMADTQRNFRIDARWTGNGIPYTYYRNNPSWNGSQYIDNVQKVGLQLSITVGGQPFLWQDPPQQWSASYYADNDYWNAQGHLATSLPEGTYDVVLTLTDPNTGLSMSKTYKDAVKVALPKINYTTTITNNQTPTLNGTASWVAQSPDDGLYRAYIVPTGTVINPQNPPKSRVMRYAPDQDADGNWLSTGKWKVITNKQEYITLITQEKAAGLAQEQAKFAFNWRWNFYGISGVDPNTINTLDDLKAICSNTGVWQRIQDWWGATITSDADCQSWFQQQYDQIAANYQADLQDTIASSDSDYDLTPMPEGKYDIYLLGRDLSSNKFTQTFPGGLIIDLSEPKANLVTTRMMSRMMLTGAVSDPAATVKITINGITYTAINRGDGTWYIPAGTIAALPPGEYDVTIEVTNLAGTTTTTTSKLTVEAEPAPAEGSDGNETKHDSLSATGDSMLTPALIGAMMVLLAGALVRRSRAA